MTAPIKTPCRVEYVEYDRESGDWFLLSADGKLQTIIAVTNNEEKDKIIADYICRAINEYEAYKAAIAEQNEAFTTNTKQRK